MLDNVGFIYQIIFWIGAVDAALVLVGGVIIAAMIISGKDRKDLWDRIVPAGWAVIASSLIAAVVLFVVSWATGVGS